IANPTRTLAHHPLFQVMLTFQSQDSGDTLLGGLRAEATGIDAGAAKFDLGFSLTEQHHADGAAAGVDGSVVYATDLFERNTVETLVARLVR
ncbi:hypothetical protein, partial [Streptomyces sp. KLOTTS4A1]|uniref:hypothetical protein n=1 Tax=Streptomyces sp. KLOTTS4A1 TaxID=3390996 RepID=UPI0039F44C6C